MTERGMIWGTGMFFDALTAKDRVPDYDPVKQQHLWVAIITYEVTPAKWEREQVHLDMENMLMPPSIGCFYCEEPYQKRLLYRRCPGEKSES
jgi:hypothetical protein